MPVSRVAKSKMFREASKLNKRFVSHHGLKDLFRTLDYYRKKGELTVTQMSFMTWAYEYEFFTIDYACDKLDRSKQNFQRTILFPLQTLGYMYKHFDKLTPSQTREDHLFRSETKFNYRARFALTQKGRMWVSIFYRMADGTLKGDSSGPSGH
jgi:hypothetical protein